MDEHRKFFVWFSLFLCTISPVFSELIDIPINVGEQQIHLKMEDGADPENAIKQMTEKFQQTLSSEITRRVQENILDIDVNLGGKQVKLRFTKGEDVAAKLAEFVSSQGLSTDVGQQLSGEVMRRAAVKGFVPLLNHEVHVDGGQVLLMPVYAGQSPQAAVQEFAAKYGVSQEFVPKLLQDLQSNLVTRGLAPLGTFHVMGNNGDDLSLSLFVGENRTEKVDSFCSHHQMTEALCQEVHAEVTRAMKKEKLLPVAEYPINVNGQKQVLRVFDGETPGQALQKFSAQHQLSEEAAKELELKLRERLIEEGVAPVAAYPVQLSSSPDGKPVVLPLYKGADLVATVRDFARKHNLNEQDAQMLTQELQQELQRDGLTPMAEFNFDIAGRPAVLPLFQGQNVTQQVLAFGEAQGISPTASASILAEVDARLKAQGLSPLLDFQLQFQGKQLSLPYFQGSDLTQVVKKFTAMHSIPPEAEGDILSQLTQRLTQLGHLPVMRLPIRLGDKEEVMDVYSGETAEQAAEKFITRLGLAPSLTPQLAGELDRKMKQARIVPLKSFSIGFGGQDLSLDLYQGESVEASVQRFLQQNPALPHAAQETLAAEVLRRAQAQGVLPLVQIPLNIGDKDLTFDVYAGQDVTKEVESFGAIHGIPAASMPRLLAAVQQALSQQSNGATP